MRYITTGFLAILISITIGIDSASARMPDTNQEVVRVIKRSGFLPKNSRVSVKITGEKTIIVSTYAKPDTPEKNLIIDSVLISKSVIEKFSDVVAIRCLFYNPHNIHSYKHITVPRNIVLKFGKGELSKSQLIESLTLGKSQTASRTRARSANLSTYVPKEKMFQRNRGLILIKIRDLNSAGGNTQKYFSEFMQIEKDYVAKGYRKQASVALQNLDSSLDTAIREMQLSINLKNSKRREQAGGMFVNRRNAVLDQINGLAARGKDVSTLMKIYNQTVTPNVNNPSKKQKLDQALTVLEHKLRYMR